MQVEARIWLNCRAPMAYNESELLISYILCSLPSSFRKANGEHLATKKPHNGSKLAMHQRPLITRHPISANQTQKLTATPFITPLGLPLRKSAPQHNLQTPTLARRAQLSGGTPTNLHVLHGARVAHCLCAHDALHVGAPAKLGGHKCTRGVSEPAHVSQRGE